MEAATGFMSYSVAMATRHEDWLWQAKRDLEQARSSMASGFHEWACFASQQAAEKALKALFQRVGADAWGHSLADLVAIVPAELAPPPSLELAARRLDKHYIPTRYPDSLPSGAPGQSYTEGEAQQAILDANEIIGFCESHIH